MSAVNNVMPNISRESIEASARKWLGPNVDCVDLYIETMIGNDDFKVPHFLRIQVNVCLLCEVQRKNAYCLAESFNGGEKTQVRSLLARDHTDNEVEEWYLYVDTAKFGFEGECGGSCVVATQEIELQHLSAWLQGVPSAETLDAILDGNRKMNGFQWYGGSLIYAPQDMAHVLTYVLDEHPEVEARQVAIEMEARIRAHGVTPSTEVSSRHRKMVGL